MTDIDAQFDDAQPIEVTVADSQPIEVTIADRQPINVSVANEQPISVSVVDGQPIDVQLADVVEVNYYSGGADKNYEQPFVDQTVLNITHNLHKKPSITVIDTASDEVQGSYEYVDNNNVKITFSTTFSGTITLN